MEEKKVIKMSLWSFFVLMAGIVILIGGIIIGAFAIINKEKASQTMDGIQDTTTIIDSMGSAKENSFTNNTKTEVNSNVTNDVNVNDEKIMTQVNETATNTASSNQTEVSQSNQTVSNNTTASYNPTVPTTNASENLNGKQYILYTNGTAGKLDSNDLNYNTVLSSRIDYSKSVNSVNNYASTMKWYVYDNLDYRIEYPSDWNIEWPNNGIEQVRISGKAIGKQMTEDGENGDKVVEADMMLIVYEPVICTINEISRMELEDVCFFNGENAEWMQVLLEGNNVLAGDNYTFLDNGDGTYKMIRVRILNANGGEQTYKTINIENYFLGTIAFK